MKKEKMYKILLICILISIIYTVLVKFVDVDAIGPNNSMVGFATINDFFKGLIGYNESFYKISKYLGIIPFLIVVMYSLIGLIQLIKRKSIKKVDMKILLMGWLYIFLGIVYVFFECVVINYRPVLDNGHLEASYPSSHTMLAVTICLSSLLISKYYIKNKNLNRSFELFTLTLMIVLVITRTLSGVHWISDILGGIIISTTLVILYKTNLMYFDKR